MYRQKKSPPRAFTLLELLIAMTGGAVVLASLAIALNGMSENFSRGKGHIGSATKARLAISLLTADLESAILRGSAGEWLHASPEVVSAGSGASATRAHRLTLFSPAQDRYRARVDPAGSSLPPVPIFGDVCAIVYQLAYQDPIDGSASNPIFSLYRGIAPSDETWGGTPPALGADDVWTDFWQARADGDGSNAGDALIDHVADFAITAAYADALGNVVHSDPADGFRIADGAIHNSGGGILCELSDLRYIRLNITVLTERGASRVGLMDMDELIKRESYSFTRRIELPIAAALVR